METKKENTEDSQKTSTAMAGMPDWVMHLLTGLGTMGADFLLFIKPLQDKFEVQSNLIKLQEKTIEDLKDKMEVQNKQQEKRITELEDKLEVLAGRSGNKEKFKQHGLEEHEDLFNLKRKIVGTPRLQKLNYVKL